MANAIKPNHYQSGKIDVIESLWQSMPQEWFRGFMVGNVIKYVMRYPQKGGIEDLEKAREYIDRLIEAEEKSEYPALSLEDVKRLIGVKERYKADNQPPNIFTDIDFPDDTICCEENERGVLVTMDVNFATACKAQVNLKPADAIRFANKLTEIANEIVDERMSGGPL